MPEFKEFPLRIVSPEFDSPLTDALMELNHLRRRQLYGSTTPWIFFQLKEIFHLLESVGSARIEGNHTTIAEYVEQKIEHAERSEDRFSEIANVEQAMQFIEEEIEEGSEITHRFIRELHQLAVTGLTREGDDNPGAYRSEDVSIAQSDHLPPPFTRVQDYMDELLELINEKHSDKYDLLKVAVAHHRFTWIHPFGNGNGRVVRLLTYALLIKYGFNVKQGKLLNPTAVFCNDREKYYETLAVADSGTAEDILKWCEYVTRGILEEIVKVDKLLDFEYLNTHILLPALAFGLDRKQITDQEYRVLKQGITTHSQQFTSSDLTGSLKELSSRQRTHLISKMKDARLILSFADKPRTYHVNFMSNVLMRGLMKYLEEEGFTPSLNS